MIYFIGEKRSEQAIRNNWHWDDNVSTAKYLTSCLTEIGILPIDIIFVNLWSDDGRLHDWVVELLKITELPVVGMGQIVGDELDRHEIKHIKIIHPAARGKIRNKKLYTEHLKEKLGWTIATEKILKERAEVFRELAKL